MSKATPINKLRNEEQIENVLNELEEDAEQINQQHQNRMNEYQYDTSQISHFKNPLDEEEQEVESFAPVETDWKTYIYSIIRLPVIFVMIYVFLSMGFGDYVFNYLPPNLNNYKMFIRALLGGFMMLLGEKFVPTSI